MYESGYNKMFWGMIFIIFNFNIGPINLLPNFVGYILIVSGLNALTAQHRIYEKGKFPAIILAVTTLRDIINLGEVNLLGGQVPQLNLWLTTLGIGETLLNIYLIFIICRGIYLLAEERELTELRDSAKGRFRFYLGITVLFQFYRPFSLNLSRHANVLMIVFVIINIIALLYIAGLFKKSRVQLRN